MNERAVLESPRNQGTDERIPYVFDFENWGTPSVPSVTITDTDTGTNVSSTCLTGSASISGYKVTCPVVHSLEAGHRYKLTCKVVIGTATQSAYLELVGE